MLRHETVIAQCTATGSININNTSLCSGQSTPIVFYGGDPGSTYGLYVNGSYSGTQFHGLSTSSGPAQQSVGTATPGNSYQIRGTLGNCSTWTSSTVSVTSKQPSSLSITTNIPSGICAGTSITLTAQGGSNLTWSTQTVTPMTTTSYTVYGNESNCGSSTQATRTVNVSPAVGQVTITAGPTSFCQGTVPTSTFTASASNVNYYDWTISPYGMGAGQAGTIDAINGVVTWNPNFSGTATIAVKATSGQYCMAVTNTSLNVTIIPMPLAPTITSPISVVYNSTISLQAGGAGANEVYTWYTSQSSTTPISPNVGPLNAASTYTYYAGKKNTFTGCETLPGQRSVLTVNMYVDPPAAPATSLNTCGPRIITLSAPPTNVTWYWQGNSSTALNTNTPINAPYTYSIATSGTYYVRAKANTINLWSNAILVSTVIDPVDINVLAYDPANPVVQATYSITLDEGFSVPSGGTFSANIVITSECNDFVNWTEQILYDQNGVAISDSRSYFDGFGTGIESQSKDFLSKKVFASQPIFDSYNSAAGASLPAPIQESDFIYKKAIITNATGTPYAADDFDKRTNTNVANSGEINYPKPVGNQPGTTGWYYSSSNNLEPNTPVTQYPYSREYSPEGPDPKMSVGASPGDEFRMGTGHETKSEKTIISADDAAKLSHYYALRHFFSNSTTPYGAGKGYRYITTDANGKQAVSFVDADGRSIVSAVATLVSGTVYSYDYWSYNFYNDIGQVTATVASKDVITSNTTDEPPSTKFSYDHLGRLIETTSPDEGTSRFVYSTDGKIRFSESQLQRDGAGGIKRFSYTNYDQLGRLIESGEYTATSGGYLFEPHSTLTPASNSVLNIVDNNFIVPIDEVSNANYTGISKKLDAARCSEHNFITYDLPGSGSPAAQDFLFGQVSKTENENAITWYSYDEDGLLTWMKQSINGLGIKTISYTYDYFGNVTQVAYQAGQGDAFYHHYTYDISQRLTEVRTSKDATNKTLQANYYYYLHGPLKRVELAGNLQGIDYVYTIDGSLKSINHADVSKDPSNDGSNGVSADVFGMTLEYHPDDYQGAGYNAGTISGSGATNYYNGLIKSASWFTPVDNPSTKNIYEYSYDNLYQFQNARFGSVTGTAGNYSATFSAAGAYNETVPSYDKNGNILSLSRKGKTGTSLANFTYNYSPGTNKLNSITGSATISYTYNSIGQLIQQTEGSVTTKVSYNAYGLVKEVRNGSDQLLTTYSYDDHGDMVKRMTYDAGTLKKTTFYVHDAAGNVLAIYEQPNGEGLTLMEVPIYGAGRLATYKPASTTFYEINDHLGNVRAVIGAPSTEVITATMESENAATEDLKFKNIAPRQVSTAANNTAGGNEAIRINNGQPSGGYPGRSTGAGIVLHVAPGDMISAEVFGYYEGGNGYSNSLPLATIVSNVATAFGGASGAPGDPGKIFSSFNSAINSGMFDGAGGTGSDSEPAAYLNMIMFDENMISDPAKLPMAAAKLSSAANMNKQKISIGPINIPAPGYVYIYVNNNSDVSNWIYFDDLKVTHLHSPFVAGGDYYPFGLSMDDRQIKIEDYRYGYQGQYSEKNSQTGWNEFDLRMYDARTGRWISPDPYGQYASPYIGMGNNPVSGADPDGGFCCEGMGVMLPEVVVTAAKSVSDSFLSGIGIMGVALRSGGNYMGDRFIGATTIVNGINRSVVGDWMPEFGGSSQEAQTLRWQGYMFGTGVQLMMSYGMKGGAPSGMPSLSTPNGSVVPITQPVAVPIVTTLDERGLVYSNSDLGNSNSAKLKSRVKEDPKLSKLAKETFAGNSQLQKEANGLLEQLNSGNINPGIGTKSIGNGIFEARSRGGARVYFRNVGEKIEIVGYSNKANQQAVINRILEIY